MKPIVCRTKQQATLLEAKEDNKVQVVYARFYQTTVSSELHNFELSARYVAFS